MSERVLCPTVGRRSPAQAPRREIQMSERVLCPTVGRRSPAQAPRRQIQ